MRSTPLPVRPCDVAVLTVPESTCQLHSSETVSIDVVCQRFPEDINRARGLVHSFSRADGVVRPYGHGVVAAIGALAQLRVERGSVAGPERGASGAVTRVFPQVLIL
jgi:hypothetical protein